MFLPEYKQRRQSLVTQVGSVLIGGDNPIVVQAMTDTDTADEEKTASQCLQLAKAGAQLVRITVNTPKAAAAVSAIKSRLEDKGWNIPLVGDFHYNGHKLLTKYKSCAQALEKYRINPGNVDYHSEEENHFNQIIQVALEYEKPIRIGVNWGSLDQRLLTKKMEENAKQKNPESATTILRQALVESALHSAAQAEKLGMASHQILLSCKTSDIPDLLAVYRDLARRCHYGLHLGLTEAGLGLRGIVATTSALSILLSEGIGDTIRASLTPAVEGCRTDEVRLCCDVLQSMQLRAFSPQVKACPGCGRTTSTLFRHLAATVESKISKKMPLWKERYPGVETMKIAVMGCIVNGPGESKHADIGISLPGSGESPVAPVYVDGKKMTALKGEHIADEFIAIIENYIQNRF